MTIYGMMEILQTLIHITTVILKHLVKVIYNVLLICIMLLELFVKTFKDYV